MAAIHAQTDLQDALAYGGGCERQESPPAPGSCGRLRAGPDYRYEVTLEGVRSVGAALLSMRTWRRRSGRPPALPSFNRYTKDLNQADVCVPRLQDQVSRRWMSRRAMQLNRAPSGFTNSTRLE